MALSRELLIGSSVGAGEDFSYKIIAIDFVVVIVTIIVIVVIFIIVTFTIVTFIIVTFIIVTIIVVTGWAREISMANEMWNGKSKSNF